MFWKRACLGNKAGVFSDFDCATDLFVVNKVEQDAKRLGSQFCVY